MRPMKVKWTGTNWPAVFDLLTHDSNWQSLVGRPDNTVIIRTTDGEIVLRPGEELARDESGKLSVTT